MNSKNYILADGRWSGQHGIGRFSTEVLSRLKNAEIFLSGPKPLSLKNLIWLPDQLKNSHYKVLYTPGFNPIAYSPIPHVFTICDLIHLEFPGKYKIFKKFYYNYFIKMKTRTAFKIVTISEYSKNTIIDWAKIPEKNVINVSCGISTHLSPEGQKYNPGYPYLLHVGNIAKPHKNVDRLIQAFSLAKIDPNIRLILTGTPTIKLTQFINKHLNNRVIFSNALTEAQLAEYYRGATAVVFPSLYEGFGLPVAEGMACGTPTLTSHTTSLPEVAGDASLLVDPYNVESITHGIEQMVNHVETRKSLISKGLQRAKLFSWEETTNKVQTVLNAITQA